MKLPLLFMIALLSPGLVLAQNTAEVVKIDNKGTANQRFIPLNRESAGSGPVVRKIKPLRSDRDRLQSDFKPLRGAVPVAHPIPLKQPGTIAIPINPSSVALTTPSVIKGTPPVPETDGEEPVDSVVDADPVLSLFGGSKDEQLLSFRDALMGKITQQASGTGRFSWPLPASVKQQLTSGFGLRTNPFNSAQSEFHGGIDIAADAGTAVLATADGGVSKVGNDPRYGKYIAILHGDGSESHYGHLSAINVTQGQLVRAGQTIGAVGATGRATGPHLDYRISQNGARIDPMSVLHAPASLALDPSKAPLASAKAAEPSERIERSAKTYKLITVR